MIQAVYAERVTICTAINKEKAKENNLLLRTIVRSSIMKESMEEGEYETKQSGQK